MIDWSSNDPYNSFNNLYYNEVDVCGIYINKNMNLDNQFSYDYLNRTKIENNKKISSENIDINMPSIYISNDEIKNSINKNDILLNINTTTNNDFIYGDSEIKLNQKENFVNKCINDDKCTNDDKCINNKCTNDDKCTNDKCNIQKDYNSFEKVIPSVINKPIKNYSETYYLQPEPNFSTLKKSNFISRFDGNNTDNGNNMFFILFLIFIILIYTELKISNIIKLIKLKNKNKKNNNNK